MDIDFFEQRFTKSEVVQITGVPPLTLQNWLHRNVINVSPKQKGGTGNRRLFSPFDMVKIATVMQLSEMDVPPSRANEIIASDKFQEWVSLCLLTGDENPESHKYHFAVLHKVVGEFVVDYISTAKLWDYFERANEDVRAGSKVFMVIRILDIVVDVKHRATDLIYDEMDESEREKLGSVTRSVMAMRRAVKDSEND